MTARSVLVLMADVYSLDWLPAPIAIGLGVAGWLVAGLLLGVLLGRVVRHREAQVPRDASPGELQPVQEERPVVEDDVPLG